MKAEFDLILYDDETVKEKLQCMGTLEAAFDDRRNDLPNAYYFFADRLPLGSHIRITIELLTLRDEQKRCDCAYTCKFCRDEQEKQA